MKRILFFITFTGILMFTGKLTAQTLREPSYSTQKSDDGVLVAYPNPARDMIVVKAKDSSLKINSVTFYSILGVQVANVLVNANYGEINLERLRSGKYFMKYTMSDNTQKITQIIKQ